MTDVVDVVDSTAVMERSPASALAGKIGTEELAAELLARAEGDAMSESVTPGQRVDLGGRQYH